MKFDATLVDKLRQRAARFDEITELLGDPEVAGDGRKLAVLLRERGSLERSQAMYAELQALTERRAEDDDTIADD